MPLLTPKNWREIYSLWEQLNKYLGGEFFPIVRIPASESATFSESTYITFGENARFLANRCRFTEIKPTVDMPFRSHRVQFGHAVVEKALREITKSGGRAMIADAPVGTQVM